MVHVGFFRFLCISACFILKAAGELLMIEPSRLVVEYGAEASANCSTTIKHKGMGWESSQGPVDMRENVEHITWTVQTLTHWDIKPLCYINQENGNQLQKELPVIIYKLPDTLSISSESCSGPVIEGESCSLQCDVQNVAPVQYLKVMWYKEQFLMKNISFNETSIQPVNRSINLVIQPSRNDDGALYWCEAKLELGPEGPQPPPTNRSGPFRIAVYSAGELLMIEPSRLVVEYGAEASANCSTTIKHKGMGWESSQGPVDMRENVEQITWTVQTLTHWDIKPLCFINQENGKKIKKELPVIIYKLPDTLSISSESCSGPVIEGESCSLQCDVQNVAPVQYLKVMWYKEQFLMKNISFNETSIQPVNRSINLVIQPSRNDDGALYWCEAKLELGPEGPQPPPTNRSGPFRITLHSAGELLIIEPSRLVVEYGAEASANCSTTIKHKGMGWESSQGPVDMIENVQHITWTVQTLTHWDIKPLCYINRENGKKIKKILPVIIYKLPDTLSIISGSCSGPVIEGKSCSLQCDVQNVAPVQYLKVMWHKEQFLIKNISFNETSIQPVNRSINLVIQPSRNDDGALYWCEAKLELGPEGPQPPPTNRSGPFRIVVHYKPLFSNDTETLEIKDVEIILNCTASAHPSSDYTWDEPHLEREVKKTGPSLPVSRPGNYTCTASNRIGNAKKLFIVKSKYQNHTSVWIIVGVLLVLITVIIVPIIIIRMRLHKRSDNPCKTSSAEHPKEEDVVSTVIYTTVSSDPAM